MVGKGTPASCTSQAVVNAVAAGGVITFDCGPDPVTIKMAATARVFNNRPNVVIDGGGLVTLDGQGARRILYMNTCDPDLVWTTSHCQDQDHPTLTVQNVTFVERPVARRTRRWTVAERSSSAAAGSGSSTPASTATAAPPTGPDIGGASIQVFSQHDGLPVYVVDSTFGGSGARRNECSNGGGISS